MQRVVYGGASTRPFGVSHKQWSLQKNYSDEFNGRSLDTTKWNSDVKDWGVWSWEPDNVWVDNGLLELRMKYKVHSRNGHKFYYTSGIIKSNSHPIKYGFFESKIMAAPLFPGVCPAFWAYRHEKNMWTEIDFVELTEKTNDIKLIDINIHAFIHPRVPKEKKIHQKGVWKAPWDPRKAFHVYGCEWNIKEIKWYIDGELVQTQLNKYWHQALDVTLSFGVRSPLIKSPTHEGFPTFYQVDYIRVWKEDRH